MVPDLQRFNFWFFNFTTLWKQYIYSRNHTLNFEFWSFPGLTSYGTILPRDAGQQQPDGFAQLQANVSVLSASQAGQAELRGSVA